MVQPLISIICPVYMAEEYLPRCIESVIRQTLDNWELILVDDGSPDKSGEICDKYSEKDKRIKVIHKDNGGVSNARQTGLKSVNSDYVIHVDPDDWIESTMLEELYNESINTCADMVICDFYYNIGDKQTIVKQEPSSLDSQVVLRDMFRNIHGSCCNKLVKLECIKKCNATFPENINYCEDVCFNMQLLASDIKVSYIGKAFYHYVIRNHSITIDFTETSLLQCEKYVGYLQEKFPDYNSEILRAKEMTKIKAFHSQSITKERFYRIYPEIHGITYGGFVNRVFYFVAFGKLQPLARILLKLKNI